MQNKSKDRYYNNNRASKAIYGVVLLFVTIVGLHSINNESALALGVSTLLTALTIVFAEIYSEIIGTRIKNKGNLTKIEKKEIINDSFAIASVSFWPSLIFFASSLGLYSVTIAFNLTYLYLLCVLFAFSYLASRLSGLSNFKSYIFALINVFVGLLVIFLKYFVGH